MKRQMKRFCSVILFVALLLQILSFATAAQASTYAITAGMQTTAAEDYGLPSATKDGVIFHAWNWSFNNIKDNLPDIAEAGYKSIQTSPIQGTKEASVEGSKWWVLYQPINFAIGNTQLGSRDQFKSMCEEAEKYGIKIIVDVIANHMGNAGGGNLTYTPANNVDSSIRNNSYFWHEARGVNDWNNRWEVTHLGIGLPDLNTSNQQLQDKIIDFLNDAIACGADGFRFDAAKHIELPSDSDGSNFWTRVLSSLTNRSNLYIYGEVLQGGADAFSTYANYINVTPSSYGHSVRSSVGFGGSKNVNNAKFFNTSVSPSKLVTWVESHDSYANDSNESTYMNEWQIKMGWALIAARAETTSLFFNRPAGDGKFASKLGTTGTNLWKDADIAAVNKFHNAMAGQGEYLRSVSNDVLLIDRGTKGTMIVNLGSDAQINSVTNLASGTYTNKASAGGTFTVSNGKITGFLGGGKIAVLYEAEKPVPQFTIDAQEGGFYSDTLTVKMTYSGATTATYTLNGGTATTFNSGDTVTFGAGAAFGTTFVLKLTASNDAGQSTKTFTFTKEDPNAVLTVHYYKPSSWGTPNIYFYDDTITPTKIGAIWPGVAMTSESNGWYGYRATGWKQGKVIFNSGSNQIPGASQPGYSVSGEKWIKDGVIYSTNPNVVTPGISIDKTEGIFYGDSLDVTVSLKDETAATYTLNGGAAIAVTSGQKITIGAGDAYGTTYALTVNASNASKSTTKTYTFVKTKQVLPAPTVTIDKPEGTFYSDKLDVTVSFTNASAATYSLNGAEPAALTSGQKIMIGSGDSYGTTYTLIVNAYNEDNSTTKTYTFVKTKQELPAPIISIDKAEGTFTTDSLDVTVTYKDATVATYSLNGAEPAALASGQKITIGAGDTDGSTYTLTVIASNEDKSTTKTYTFKKQKQQSFTVHFYNPTGWSTPNIYFYDETVTPKKENATWPGTAMSSEGNGWYFYTITGWDNAYVMFNSNGKQTPAANQPGYLISKSSWIKDGVIADQQPVNELVPVTFVIKNATTYYGQNVYITGNLAELGDWDPAKAIGPASNQSYTDWSITINLPEGTTIEFKAIKKEGDGIVWEGGSNHSYKVSSSNPVVEFYFYN